MFSVSLWSWSYRQEGQWVHNQQEVHAEQDLVHDSYLGAPLWYITLSPADNKHPIFLYFADDKESMNIKLLQSDDEQYHLITNNPVAGAHFFHFMVEMFTKHVFGVGTEHWGLYGETSGYYGTVKQQGHLTLHLHMLLWICGTFSPDEVCARTLEPTSTFHQRLVDYLESVHAGDFLLKSKEEVESDVKTAAGIDGYCNPTETLPKAPPTTDTAWWSRFRSSVNDLLLKSNVHECSTDCNQDGFDALITFGVNVRLTSHVRLSNKPNLILEVEVLTWKRLNLTLTHFPIL